MAKHRHRLGPCERDVAYFAYTRRCVECRTVVFMFPFERMMMLHERHPWRLFVSGMTARQIMRELAWQNDRRRIQLP